MSGPYRFNQESAKSPLDRTPSPFSAGQPVSFKTNVNRMKTKKWVTAKKNAYDGDDWGEYDEYDEYGVDQEPPPQQPASQRYYAQQPERTNTDRSFTDPTQRGPPGKARRNSFEAGEEHRAFSASISQPQSPQNHEQSQYMASQQAHNTGSSMGQGSHGQRDFSASAVPPPLNTRVSPVPIDVHVPSSNTQFSPQQTSAGQADSPSATSPRPRTGSSSEKPLPFIRPADIYRRVEEERERERASLDSSRPSLDSLTSRPKDDIQSPTAEGARTLKPLETVAERKSEYLPDFNVAKASGGLQQNSNGLTSGPEVQDTQGFRSVVSQAFTRTDDQRSIPPTPVSKDSETDISRTNTGSTSGISPIMSRVPSSATSAIKRSQAGGDGSTPVIVEESHEALQSPSTSTQAAPRPMADHTRNLSSSSLARSADSPARSPIIEPQKNIPEPATAQVSSISPDRIEGMDGGLTGPSAAYTVREADMASASKGSTKNKPRELGAAEKDSQDAFLESHHATASLDDALPRSRSESPSKGRVQALAGKFGEVSSSRRGSTQSNASRHSVQSWERSNDHSRAPSPTKANQTKPSSPVKEFRPHLPGQWESFATTAATPSDQGDRELTLGHRNTAQGTAAEDVELTPTTAKHSVADSQTETLSDPLTALKSAGAAMAQSFKATVGLDGSANDNSGDSEDQTKSRAHGDIYMPRPLQLDRTASSISSIPPTPPEKDTPASEYPPPPPLKDPGLSALPPTSSQLQQKRPEFLPQLSTAPSAEDEESDRLRKEIVASLSPVRTLETPPLEQNRSSLRPISSDAHRMSSVLPAEYDSYWADGGQASSRLSQDIARNAPETPTTAAVPSTPPPAKPIQPALLNRFSWEANSPHLMTPESAPTIVVPEPSKTVTNDKGLSPVTEHVVAKDESSYEKSSEPLLPHEQPASTTQPEEGHVHDGNTQQTIPPAGVDSLSSPTRVTSRSSGLHVVNSAVDPEAVDLPPRLGADLASPILSTQDDLKPLPSPTDREVPNPAISTSVPLPEPTVTSPSQETHVKSPSHIPPVTSPTTDKPLGEREIATINSTAERILTYNKTRDQWATLDHGLQGWLASALEENPDLSSPTPFAQRTSTGTIRHKHTASLSLLGKLGGSNSHQTAGPGQHDPASSQMPVPGGSPANTASPGSGAGFDRRAASAQMQMKGKDLLHSAGALSGKGLTSAKGLFAKGKSRFGRDKVEK